MRPSRIDQIVPSFAGRDAIGTHVLHTRDVLRQAGYRSDVWAIDVLPEVRHQARPLGELDPAPQPGTWWLFHHSIGTPAADLFAARPEPKLLDYHNITPAGLIERWAPWVRDEVELGRRQLAELAPVCFFAMADSAYNAAELEEVGYRHSTVVPPLFDLASFERAVDPVAEQRLRAARRGGGRDWLFVGRLSPHKAQHELIKALAVHRQLFDPDARLHLVGTALGEDYPRALRRYAQRLGVGDAVDIPGLVSAGELAAYYEVADVFVCASQHEGFCVPVVEAMHLGVPVVARDSAAVPETLAGAGLVLHDHSALALAVAVHHVLGRPAVRQALADAGRARAQDFSLDAGRRRLLQAVEDAVAVAGDEARLVATPDALR